MTAKRGISPMLATLGTPVDIHDESDWAFEMKWDGIRIVATITAGNVTLASRNGIDQTATYPELGELAAAVKGSAVLDGEVVAVNRKGRPDFGLLQNRMGLTEPRAVAAAAKKTPVQFMIFDILESNGTSQVAKTYDDRRKLLSKNVKPSTVIQVPPAFDGDLTAAIDTSSRLGLEGVMAKTRDGTYSVGRRSRAWIKLKHHRAQEVVIGGWRPGEGRRAKQVGSLLMGIPTEKGLEFVGRIGTGFTDRQLDDLTELMAKLERKTSPFVELTPAERSKVRFTKPTLVAEVEFAEWTPTGKLRQPSWRGWRPDKKPGDIVRES
jgi:bifunctional non-homologous end joining protein LigD